MSVPYELAEFEVFVKSAADGSLQPVTIASTEDSRKFYGSGAGLTIDSRASSRWIVKAAKPSGDRVIADYTFEEPIAGGPGTELVVAINQKGLNARVSIGRFRISLTTEDKPTIKDKVVGIPEDVFRAARRHADIRSGAENSLLLSYYRAIALTTKRKKLYLTGPNH